jgi:hypothetical protein
MTRYVPVIPGRCEAANPESIDADRDYGFRVRAVSASRNDENFEVTPCDC